MYRSMILAHNDKILQGGGLISRGFDAFNTARQVSQALLNPRLGPDLIVKLARTAYRYNTIKRQSVVPPGIRLIAQVAAAAYAGEDQRPLEIGGAQYMDDHSTSEICVYKNETQWIVGVRGTVLGVADLADDLAIAAGGLSADSSRVRDLVGVVKRLGGGSSILMTGHSLAGAICTLASKQTGHPSINFNIGTGLVGEGAANGLAQQHIIRGDVISNTALGGIRGADVRLYDIQKKDLPAHTIRQFM